MHYFIMDMGTEANRAVSAETTIKIQGEYGDVFRGIGCFKGTFSYRSKMA